MSEEKRYSIELDSNGDETCSMWDIIDSREDGKFPISTSSFYEDAALICNALNTQSEPSEGLFEFLAHGDEQHRAWLKEAIQCFYKGLSRPEVVESKPTAPDELVREIDRQLNLNSTEHYGGLAYTKPCDWPAIEKVLKKCKAALTPVSTKGVVISRECAERCRSSRRAIEAMSLNKAIIEECRKDEAEINQALEESKC